MDDLPSTEEAAAKAELDRIAARNAAAHEAAEPRMQEIEALHKQLYDADKAARDEVEAAYAAGDEDRIERAEEAARAAYRRFQIEGIALVRELGVFVETRLDRSNEYYAASDRLVAVQARAKNGVS